MLFNSIDFVVFLPIVFILYWWVGGNDPRRRNLILLIASYVFYGWWDPRFLVLIAFSTLVDYFVGVRLGSTSDARSRKYLLWTSLAVNFGLLGYFKYSNFFLESFVDAFSLFGQPFSIGRLNIILPVGISFYTFQTLSYSIDVYRNKMQPTNDPVAFATYVSFFPQLVAGPIERAEKLLPQFGSLRTFRYDMAVDGARQMLWGLFKKMVIADNCAFEVDRIFGQYHTLGGATLLLGSVLFAFQIYCDFSGYSDIAIGCARLFGFQLMKNFAFPYFSRDIAEFWRRWHISLSTWFRDYLYVPLGRFARWHRNESAQHVHHLHRERLLAWCKLDFLGLGCAQCLLFPSPLAQWPESDPFGYCGAWSVVARCERAGPYALHVLSYLRGLGLLPGPRHGPSIGILARHVHRFVHRDLGPDHAEPALPARLLSATGVGR